MASLRPEHSSTLVFIAIAHASLRPVVLWGNGVVVNCCDEAHAINDSPIQNTGIRSLQFECIVAKSLIYLMKLESSRKYKMLRRLNQRQDMPFQGLERHQCPETQCGISELF